MFRSRPIPPGVLPAATGAAPTGSTSTASESFAGAHSGDRALHRRRLRQRFIGVPLVLTGVAAPGLERLATAEIADGLRSRSGEFSMQASAVDVVLDGLVFQQVRLRGPGVDVTAEDVRVHANTAGLSVVIGGLAGVVTPNARGRSDGAEPANTAHGGETQAARAEDGAAGTASDTRGASASSTAGHDTTSEQTSPRLDSLDRLRARFHGVPVHVLARGAVVVESGARSVRLGDPEVNLSPEGSIDVKGKLVLRDPALPALAVDTLHARTREPLAKTESWRRADWRFSGTLALQADDGITPASLADAVPAEPRSAEPRSAEPGSAEPRSAEPIDAPHAAGTQRLPTPLLGLRGDLENGRLSVQLASPEGGQAAIATQLIETEPAPWVVVASLEAFPLAVARPWLAESNWAPHVSLQDTTVSGTVQLTRRAADDVSVALRGVIVDGIVVDHPRIAREPLGFDALSVDGELHRGQTVSGQLEIGHRGAELVVGGSLGDDRVEFSAELAPIPCQNLLDAMPDGLLPALQGTTFAGTFDARFDVGVSPSTLVDFHPGYFDDPTPPGARLEVRLPFFERCTLVQEPTAVDAAAVAGPYRHRFLSDGGREIERVLAPGGEDFFALASRPEVGLVFVALEDMNFFEHDGFDEQQIERAFWHNLSAGRIERGASTISQQTARNLWLGVDRSLSRKLQEALLTSRLEAAVDKRRILEVYVNVIELGPEVHGVAEAARYHFDREIGELNFIELVHLASMAPAPVTYAKRFASGEVDTEWRAKLEGHVARMARLGLIDETTAAEARRAPLRLVSRS